MRGFGKYWSSAIRLRWRSSERRRPACQTAGKAHYDHRKARQGRYDVAMAYRFFSVPAVALAIAAFAGVQSAGQAPSAKPASKSTWTPTRTPDGQPDLQGYWTNATFTPLERPAEF